ncbi:MAG: rRNA methyltransferase, partial [bacterium]
FCGTGKKFIRNLSYAEIVKQVIYVLKDMNIEDVNGKSERFQIMFMSMGEPFLNYPSVECAIRCLNEKHQNAELLVSTMGPKCIYSDYDSFLNLSSNISKVGLQFSVHESFDEKRNELIPYKNKLSLREMRDYGIQWNKTTYRPVYINYCIHENNQSIEEMERLKDLFSPNCFNFTFSVICSADENMKEAGYKKLDRINDISQSFLRDGYNVRVFNPAGQDDIGGGCGQLWYVQNWLKERNGN